MAEMPEPEQDNPSGWLRRFERPIFAARTSLTIRILAVNVIALALLAGSFFFLDNYRRQLLEERFRLAISEAQITAEAIKAIRRQDLDALMVQIGEEQRLRLRLYEADGTLLKDSFDLGPPSFALIDPMTEPWYQHAARALDRGMDFILGAEPVPPYVEPEASGASAWPEIALAQAEGRTQVFLRYAPDRTPVITAAAPVGARGRMLLTTRNAIDITESVRDARQMLAIIVALALIVSIQLSLYLARTIIQPLRMLVRAAVRVRLGRDREVVVPRLPERRDEIGLLARAVSDMTQALRQRIDSIEAFAADVTHELKNPLASLRSAVDTLAMVKDPALQAQLLDVIGDDVRRLDRLITDIAEASRVDAELARARFEPIDLGVLIAGLIAAQEARNGDSGIRLAFARPHLGTATVNGDESRLMRAFDNLIDNAMSFSEPGGLVQIGATRDGDQVIVHVQDEGPGVRAEQREAIFRRFHSERPDGEAFGKHSGLGLAIAKAIVEGHDGSISVRDRDDAQSGARFEIRLPVATV